MSKSTHVLQLRKCRATMLMTVLNPTLERRREQFELARDYRAGLRCDRERLIITLADGKSHVVVQNDTPMRRAARMVQAVAVNKEA